MSWRVMLLPFLGAAEEDLYRHFYLDEPWDSEHNQKLVALMPKVYASPGSNVEPGKTQFLAIRSERSVIPTPIFRSGGNHPGGEIRSIEYGIFWGMVTDGLKYTIAVVEADEQSAVVWTKPDDWEYQPDKPLDGLMGQHEGFFLALFADGVVREIPPGVDQKSFQEWILCNDGKPDGPVVEFVVRQDSLGEVAADCG